jgi:hypothetical protein
MRQVTSDGYYEEVRIIPEQSRFRLRTPKGVGPGLCGLPRISLLGNSVNRALLAAAICPIS